jgi:hypothetical protein
MGQAKLRRNLQQRAIECFKTISPLAEGSVADDRYQEAGDWLQREFVDGLLDAGFGPENSWQNTLYLRALHGDDAVLREGVRELMTSLLSQGIGGAGAVFALHCLVELPHSDLVGEFEDCTELEAWIAQALGLSAAQVKARYSASRVAGRKGLQGPILAVAEMSFDSSQEVAEPAGSFVKLLSTRFGPEPFQQVMTFLVRVSSEEAFDDDALFRGSQFAAASKVGLIRLPYEVKGERCLARLTPLGFEQAFTALENLGLYEIGPMLSAAFQDAFSREPEDAGNPDSEVCAVFVPSGEGLDEGQVALCVQFEDSEGVLSEKEHPLWTGSIQDYLYALRFGMHSAHLLRLASRAERILVA